MNWTFAKTMPECPHWYLVRGKTVDEDTYFAMFGQSKNVVSGVSGTMRYNNICIQATDTSIGR